MRMPAAIAGVQLHEAIGFFTWKGDVISYAEKTKYS